MVPSIQACYRLMDMYHMLDNIRAHSVVVAKVARLIACGLQAAGIDISLDTVTVGALLHDIGKTGSLTSGVDHSQLGRDICLSHHFDEIAPIVAEHVRLKEYTVNGNYSEKEIVFYADKRVNHDQVVSLHERLHYILGRYGRGQEPLSQAIQKNFALCRQVEDKLFCKLPFRPEDLSQLVAQSAALV